MHSDLVHIDINDILRSDPIAPARTLRLVMWLCVLVGFVTFCVGVAGDDAKLAWGSYYVSLIFFMGLACGSIIITAIFQITRATWSPPLRRLAEVNVGFLPWAYALLLITYFGKEYLFPWATGPMPGREWWMQPNFVYARFAVLFGFLFLYLTRFVFLSLRGDVAIARDKAVNKRPYQTWLHSLILRGKKKDILEIQRTLSVNAPMLIFTYAAVFTLFCYEMIIGMDKSWNSNLFPAFIFIGNIYLGWAVLGMSAFYHAKLRKDYDNIISTSTFWDLGKLTFGFCMLWGYFFFSQFLPQWYGNLPEETQWMILRAREFPWKGLGWVTFSACFVCPFILLLSEDLKRAPHVFATVCLLIFVVFGLSDT